MKIKTIDVLARECFDASNGNSYFDAIVTVNLGLKNELMFRLPFQYGYEGHYKDCAFETLKNKGLIVTDETMFGSYYKDNNIVARHSKKAGYNYQAMRVGK
ncbi:hypothetical protein LCGC14_0342230 [marine sediment metagenome]|uniref:Phage protein n=1 Tax=marine sediment metagenome TaxID=412755 RepID=A0A0F9W0L2_9ZZZZ